LKQPVEHHLPQADRRLLPVRRVDNREMQVFHVLLNVLGVALNIAQEVDEVGFADTGDAYQAQRFTASCGTDNQIDFV
jgi:hypothetical protein